MNYHTLIYLIQGSEELTAMQEPSPAISSHPCHQRRPSSEKTVSRQRPRLNPNKAKAQGHGGQAGTGSRCNQAQALLGNEQVLRVSPPSRVVPKAAAITQQLIAPDLRAGGPRAPPLSGSTSPSAQQGSSQSARRRLEPSTDHVRSSSPPPPAMGKNRSVSWGSSQQYQEPARWNTFGFDRCDHESDKYTLQNVRGPVQAHYYGHYYEDLRRNRSASRQGSRTTERGTEYKSSQPSRYGSYHAPHGKQSRGTDRLQAPAVTRQAASRCAQLTTSRSRGPKHFAEVQTTKPNTQSPDRSGTTSSMVTWVLGTSPCRHETVPKLQVRHVGTNTTSSSFPDDDDVPTTPVGEVGEECVASKINDLHPAMLHSSYLESRRRRGSSRLESLRRSLQGFNLLGSLTRRASATVGGPDDSQAATDTTVSQAPGNGDNFLPRPSKKIACLPCLGMGRWFRRQQGDANLNSVPSSLDTNADIASSTALDGAPVAPHALTVPDKLQVIVQTQANTTAAPASPPPTPASPDTAIVEQAAKKLPAVTTRSPVAQAPDDSSGSQSQVDAAEKLADSTSPAGDADAAKDSTQGIPAHLIEPEVTEESLPDDIAWLKQKVVSLLNEQRESGSRTGKFALPPTAKEEIAEMPLSALMERLAELGDVSAGRLGNCDFSTRDQAGNALQVWLEAARSHPQYVAPEQKLMNEQAYVNEQAVRYMRSWIPPYIKQRDVSVQRLKDDGVPDTIAKRIMQRRALHLVRASPGDFKRRFPSSILKTDLYSYYGLNHVELRALYLALPANTEEKDFPGLAAYRSDVQNKLVEKLKRYMAQNPTIPTSPTKALMGLPCIASEKSNSPYRKDDRSLVAGPFDPDVPTLDIDDMEGLVMGGGADEWQAAEKAQLESLNGRGTVAERNKALANAKFTYQPTSAQEQQDKNDKKNKEDDKKKKEAEAKEKAAGKPTKAEEKTQAKGEQKADGKPTNGEGNTEAEAKREADNNKPEGKAEAEATQQADHNKPTNAEAKTQVEATQPANDNKPGAAPAKQWAGRQTKPAAKQPPPRKPMALIMGQIHARRKLEE